MTLKNLTAMVLALGALMASGMVAHGDPIHPGPTPREIACGPGSHPETRLQGQVPAADVESGRAYEGYRCNTRTVSRFGYTGIPGGSGGYKVHRYTGDVAGNECGYYDSTLLAPLNAPTQRENLTGVYVLDMSDPANPVKTANLLTPAMQSPHESLSISHRRGLLAAGMGYPTTQPGFVDIYDISQDCRFPVLLSSTPIGILGHEGNFSPDGLTLWITSTTGSLITALDVSNPILPTILWQTRAYRPHGLTLNEAGTRLYLADTGGTPGLAILDVSDIQNRVANPTVAEVGRLTWDTVSIPQNAIPITIDDHPYVVEVDEFARGLAAGDPNAAIGAARIIDIADERNPRVVSNLRLEVNMPENIAATREDPGATFQLQGYTGHYCAVPTTVDPTIVACSFILSGLRVFDIRDPHNPTEIAYFNGPLSETHSFGSEGGSYAMSAPAFAPERNEIWYSDGNSGFYAVEVTNGAWPRA